MAATKTKTWKHNKKMAEKNNPDLRSKPKAQVIISYPPFRPIADARDGL